MHETHHETPPDQQQMADHPSRSAARYPVGPSKGRSNGMVSAPGVAETCGHRGVPEKDRLVDAGPAAVQRAAEEAALYRVARRRPYGKGQRTQRVDARYSTDEKAKILAKARALGITGAHLVGAAVMAYIDGDLTLPGQRTAVDDYIDELAALRKQVARIGWNVNQIAKRLNSGGHPHPVDATVLERTERTLNAVGSATTSIDDAAHRAATQMRQTAA
ncbi:MobC family plasmid mobilization relaxosome protein [Streptomyces sp. HNM0575]|nr:plasmid mobilization relaxosome protein MobC [Streptomyces sp. HNM0575]NLU75524.1 MobC family plasmid mobilization relaxosome protein [Streptomyces sp. HNM0575]